MDFLKARAAMVDSQLRPNNIRDARLLHAFAHTPREAFLAQDQKALAYMDDAVPVVVDKGAPARSLLSPMVLGKLLEAAAPSPSDKVLDVGGICGYSAAILAQICKSVVALEASDAFADLTRKALTAAKIEGVKVVAGDLPAGHAADHPYNLIVLNGRVLEEPKPLCDQLAEGGRLVCILGGKWMGQAYIFSKTADFVSGHAVFDASGEVLPGFEKQPSFVF